MKRLRRLARVLTAVLLWTVVPYFLDRIYYRGPASANFDGQHFFNHDGGSSPDVPAGRGVAMLSRAVFGDPTRPVWPAHVAVTPSKPAARVDGGAMVATWVGHASLLVQADGVNILTDPVWADTVAPFGIGPRRVAAPGIRFEDLPKIDVVVVSHNHYDHMDLPTIRRLWERDRPLIVTSLGNASVIGPTGAWVVEGDWGQSVGVRRNGRLWRSETASPGCADDWNDCRFAVAITRNHHWSSRWLADRNRAFWSSFVVRLPHGNLFFAGDTGIGDGRWPAEAAALGPIRLAAIPVGAFRFEEGQMSVDSHIGPWDAIRVWNGLGRPRAIPIHWGTFRLSWEGYRTPPDLLAAMLRCAGEDPARFAGVAIGQPVGIAPLGEAPPAPDMAGIDRCQKAGAFVSLR